MSSLSAISPRGADVVVDATQDVCFELVGVDPTSSGRQVPLVAEPLPGEVVETDPSPFGIGRPAGGECGAVSARSHKEASALVAKVRSAVIRVPSGM